MKITFRQGLVSSEIDGNGQPSYLVGNTSGITLRASSRPIIFTVASGSKNYTIDFFKDVLAWPVDIFFGVTNCWLFIDINRSTSARSYGFSTTAPSYGLTAPANPSDGQHWFDTSTNNMKMYNASTTNWITVIRIFAGHYTTTTLEPVSVGSQVGLSAIGVSGTIVSDGFGIAMTDSRGQFMTTEDIVIVNGAASYSAKLESNVTVAPADQPIASFHVVKFNNSGHVVPADYDDVGESVVGLATSPANTTEPINLVMSGKVHNPLWNWGSANVTLWVGQNGELVAVDPFTLGDRAKRRVPVARSISPNTILFDQGLGGVGEKGDSGDVIGVVKANLNQAGIAKLSVNPDDLDNPIAVGINDPILTSPKIPVEHNHVATAITVSPFGTFNGTNCQQALEHLQLIKLSTSGGVVSGNISSTVQAVTDDHLITFGHTKQLVTSATVSYVRYILSNAQSSIVLAFNALTTQQRTIVKNANVTLEWQDAIYFWIGGAGAPVTATSTDQFILVGKLSVPVTGAVPEAPSTGRPYVRQNLSWVENTVTEAPLDDNYWSRRNGGWSIKPAPTQYFNVSSYWPTVSAGPNGVIHKVYPKRSLGAPLFNESIVRLDQTNSEPVMLSINSTTGLWVASVLIPAGTTTGTFTNTSSGPLSVDDGLVISLVTPPSDPINGLSVTIKFAVI